MPTPVEVIFERVRNDGIVWERAFTKPQKKFLRLHFESIQDDSQVDYSIMIRDGAGMIVLAYTKKQLAGKESLWTGMILGDEATVQIYVSGVEPPHGLSLIVKEIAYNEEGGWVLSITEPDNRQHVVSLTELDRKLHDAARSVALLSFIMNGGHYTCTGFMISEDLMITNEHCVPTQAVCDTTAVYFGYEYNTEGFLSIGEQYYCETLVAPPVETLDFSVLRITGQPGKPDKWGSLNPASHILNKNEPLLMVQHPYGQPKQISKIGCFISTPDAHGNDDSKPTDFGHLCDTLSGSSGSPLLSQDYRVVGLHHLGFDWTSDRWKDENRAVNISEITSEITRMCHRGTIDCIPQWSN
ncbi:MAG: trypsin-like peptidase domain-containing protein [Bacteroidia bacterium]|nr:trypsin-like peptidase domain-containing protein [Bacteroidia bacterium]